MLMSELLAWPVLLSLSRSLFLNKSLTDLENFFFYPGSTVTLGSPDSGEAAANLSGTNFHQIADEVWKESSQFSNQRIKTRNGLLKSLSHIFF